MNPDEIERLEAQLLRAARNFPYPPTPALRGKLQRLESAQGGRLTRAGNPRLAWAAAVTLLLLLAGSFTTASVRAAVAEFLQIGVVRIFQQPPDGSMPEPAAATEGAPAAGEPGRTDVPMTAAPSETAAKPASPPEDLVDLERLFGATTIDKARDEVPFAIRLPAYPAELGEPDLVFHQRMNGSVVILVWTDPGRPQRPRLSLHAITPGAFTITKVMPRVVQETLVGGRAAIWAEGPYLLIMEGEQVEFSRLIDGHVLIWEQEGVTYRLESDLSLEEAIRIAESLR